MNDARPAVSVVISTFNRRNKLERAVACVLAQTLSDIEVIVVDNASTDGTQDLVKSAQDKRLRYIRHDRNLGGPAARNTGIKAAKADLIALLDDDDEWQPLKLEAQVAKFKVASPKVGLVYVGTEIFDEKKQSVIQINPPRYRGNVYEQLLLSTILGSVSSVMVKKECFERVGAFDEALKSCQDWDMWLRIAKEYEFNYVEEVLARINMHGEQISTDFAALIPGRTAMVKKHWDEFKQHQAIFVVHLKRIGKLHCLNGTWKEAAYWFKTAIGVRKSEVIKIAAWVLIELPWVKLFSKTKGFKKLKL